jgi:hypothetical protein
MAGHLANTAGQHQALRLLKCLAFSSYLRNELEKLVLSRACVYSLTSAAGAVEMVEACTASTPCVVWVSSGRILASPMPLRQTSMIGLTGGLRTSTQRH